MIKRFAAMAAALDLPLLNLKRPIGVSELPTMRLKLDAREYWDAVGQTISRAISDSQRAKLIELDSLSWMYPAHRIVDWANALRRAGFPIALLSNMPVTLRDALAAASWLPAFHHRTLSCDVRISKPAAEIYLHCLKRARPRSLRCLVPR